MMRDPIKLCELSGIELPRELTAARDEAEKKLTRLRERHSTLQTEAQAIPGEVDSLKAELRQTLGSGGETATIRNRIVERSATLEGIGIELEELGKLISQAQEELAAAGTGDLVQAAHQALFEARKEMLAQLEQATIQRARMRDRVAQVTSTPPAKQSKSRVAVCEACTEAIGLFDPSTISLPVRGSMFLPLRGTRCPFIPRQELPYFTCPVCGRRPWLELDKILTSTGFFMVGWKEPEPQPLSAEELKTQLAERDISITAFAERLEVSQSFLSQVLAGKKGFPEERMAKATELLQTWGKPEEPLAAGE
jgi:hypothetical protein